MIRLACMLCDRDDFDGCNEMPDDWDCITFVQSYARSKQWIWSHNSRRSVLDWFTHIGTCPDCTEFLEDLSDED